MKKIINELKSNKDLELYGMKPETIVELIGFENIADDQIEDLQYYIDQAHFEAEAIYAEAEEEFKDYLATLA